MIGKYTLAVLLLVMSFTLAANAQTDQVPPYNPDSNADSLISLPDILQFLPLYGEEFIPDSLDINGLCGDVVSLGDGDICLVNSGGPTGVSEWHYYLGGHSCRTVLYWKQDQQWRPTVIHLPINDVAEGQEIHLIGSSLSNQQGQPTRIEHYVDGSWQVLVQSNGQTEWAAGEQEWRFGYVKAVYVNGVWTWQQNQSFSVPYNDPQE